MTFFYKLQINFITIFNNINIIITFIIISYNVKLMRFIRSYV